MPPRVLSWKLSEDEVEELKRADVPAYLATLDQQGYPRVTPLWFIWKEGSFLMTSVLGKSYLRNLQRNSKASICIEVETRQSGVNRPNRQLKAVGRVTLFDDSGGSITREISEKYLTGKGALSEINRRCSAHRTVVRLSPDRLIGVGGGKHLETT